MAVAAELELRSEGLASPLPKSGSGSLGPLPAGAGAPCFAVAARDFIPI